MKPNNNKYIGQKFGDLLILNWFRTGDSQHLHFLAQCSCGVETTVRKSDVIRAHTTRCGYCSKTSKKNIRSRISEYVEVFFEKPGVEFFAQSNAKPN